MTSNKGFKIDDNIDADSFVPVSVLEEIQRVQNLEDARAMEKEQIAETDTNTKPGLGNDNLDDFDLTEIKPVSLADVLRNTKK